MRPDINQDLLRKRYLQEGEKTYSDLCWRVAGHAAAGDTDKQDEYYDQISNRRFLPSRMPYMGTSHPFASSCFVLPVEDDLESIGQTLVEAMLLQKHGGGTGYNFSNLRPAKSLISTTGGDASGPVSFMRLYHNAMEVVHRAGKKHSAQMGVLNVDHPDIKEFLHCKDKEGDFWTFNISVGITDDFMEAVKDDELWDLKFNGEVYETVNAKELWNDIVNHAWGNGDPGMIFLDTVDRYNLYPEKVNATNPCTAKGTLVSTPYGLRPVEDIVVGDGITTVIGYETVKSIEMHENVDIYGVVFENRLIQYVTAAHRFHIIPDWSEDVISPRLDECINGDSVRVLTGKDQKDDKLKIISIFPAGKADVYDLYCEESDTWVTEGGIVQVGCGEIPIPPHFSCNLASIDISRFILNNDINWDMLRQTVWSAVEFLDSSIDKAYFPVKKIEEKTRKYRNIGLGVMGFADALILLNIPYDSEKAVLTGAAIMEFIQDEAIVKSEQLGKGERKNVTLTSIAPTGSISALTGCSSGIEPLFGVVFSHHSYSGTIKRVHWIFEDIAKERGFYSEDLMEEIAKKGTVQGNARVPEDVQRLFKTAMEINPEWHVKHQAAFQTHVDNAVSKTINLPNNATVEDVSAMFTLAFELGCKSTTVYRNDSRTVQVVDVKEKDHKTCPTCKAVLFPKEGMLTCLTCGYVYSESHDPVIVSVKKRGREQVLTGKTYKKNTPVGTAYITINDTPEGQPFEVFAQVGKAGTETTAMSEALGRLVSLIMRMPSPAAPLNRMDWVIEELGGIGGGRSLGFGPNRVRSFPDALAAVLSDYMLVDSPVNGSVEVLSGNEDSHYEIIGDLCPECGEAAFVRAEGCQKCLICGHSEC